MYHSFTPLQLLILIKIRFENLAMKNSRKLKDEQMRSILFEYYESQEKRLRFFEEFPLGRKTRSDALLVTETEMIGFEFKSDRDTLKRLERQVHDYERFCDRNYLVTGQKYKDKAPDEIPEHWGIYVVYLDNEETLQLECVRKAQPNTKRMRFHNQLRLLWRSELIPLIRKYQLGGVTRKNKLELVRTLEHNLEKEVLRRELLDTLIERDYSIYAANDEAE